MDRCLKIEHAMRGNCGRLRRSVAYAYIERHRDADRGYRHNWWIGFLQYGGHN